MVNLEMNAVSSDESNKGGMKVKTWVWSSPPVRAADFLKQEGETGYIAAISQSAFISNCKPSSVEACSNSEKQMLTSDIQKNFWLHLFDQRCIKAETNFTQQLLYYQPSFIRGNKQNECDGTHLNHQVTTLCTLYWERAMVPVVKHTRFLLTPLCASLRCLAPLPQEHLWGTGGKNRSHIRTRPCSDLYFMAGLSLTCHQSVTVDHGSWSEPQQWTGVGTGTSSTQQASMHCVFNNSLSVICATTPLWDWTTWAILHSPGTSMSLVLSYTTWSRYTWLQTGDSRKDWPCMESSDPVVQPPQFAPCLSYSNFLNMRLPEHQIWVLNVYLLLNYLAHWEGPLEWSNSAVTMFWLTVVYGQCTWGTLTWVIGGSRVSDLIKQNLCLASSWCLKQTGDLTCSSLTFLHLLQLNAVVSICTCVIGESSPLEDDRGRTRQHTHTQLFNLHSLLLLLDNFKVCETCVPHLIVKVYRLTFQLTLDLGCLPVIGSIVQYCFRGDGLSILTCVFYVEGALPFLENKSKGGDQMVGIIWIWPVWHVCRSDHRLTLNRHYTHKLRNQRFST